MRQEGSETQGGPIAWLRHPAWHGAGTAQLFAQWLLPASIDFKAMNPTEQSFQEQQERICFRYILPPFSWKRTIFNNSVILSTVALLYHNYRRTPATLEKSNHNVC